MDERKEKLAKALEEEAERFKIFGRSTIDHEYAIHYLRTGVAANVFMPDNYELLGAVQDDFETIYRDYGCSE